MTQGIGNNIHTFGIEFNEKRSSDSIFSDNEVNSIMSVKTDAPGDSFSSEFSESIDNDNKSDFFRKIGNFSSNVLGTSRGTTDEAVEFLSSGKGNYAQALKNFGYDIVAQALTALGANAYDFKA